MLEYMSVAYLTDAIDFFDFDKSDPGSGLKWPNLQSLALTTRAFRPSAPSLKLSNLLVAAARAALRMPKLQTMEIFNGDRELACFFRYSRQERTIYWLSTGAEPTQPLMKGVVNAWTKVLEEHNEGRVSELKVSISYAHEKDYKTHAGVLQHLWLRHLIVQPLSYCQLEWEAKHITL